MKTQKRKHTAEFKAMVALEALKGIETVHQIAARYEIHPVQVSTWKKELLDNVDSLFERKNAAKDNSAELEIARLQRKVGQLSMEVEFLEKKSVQLGLSPKGKK